LPVFRIRATDTKFPDLEQLFKGQPWRAEDREPYTFEGRVGLDGMRFPGVDARFLADFNKLLGPEARRSIAFGIARLSHTASKGDSAELMPWCLTAQDVESQTQVTYLIMPVRP